MKGKTIISLFFGLLLVGIVGAVSLGIYNGRDSALNAKEIYKKTHVVETFESVKSTLHFSIQDALCEIFENNETACEVSFYFSYVLNGTRIGLNENMYVPFENSLLEDNMTVRDYIDDEIRKDVKDNNIMPKYIYRKKNQKAIIKPIK